MLFAGIDGGQSSTIAVVVDDAGVVLGRGEAGPSDHVAEPHRSRRAADACEGALAAALAAAGLEDGTSLEAVVAGISGYEGAWYGIKPTLRARTVRYVHDAPIALAGAIDERPAAVVIAGTGSVGYAEAPGREVRVGGFGYLFGDEGSSFALARTALAGAMRASDRGIQTDLGLAALAFFDCPDLRALGRAVALNEVSRPQVASFARVVHDAARLGDAEAKALIEDAAGALAGLGLLALERLGVPEGFPVPLAFVGGAFVNEEFRAMVGRRYLDLVPRGRVVEPHYEPVIGAALLAFDAAERARPAKIELRP